MSSTDNDANPEPVKFSVGSVAEKRGCSIDDLLALAESEHETIFARVLPYMANLRNFRGSIHMNKNGKPIEGKIKTTSAEFTILLPHEAGLLRCGNRIKIRMLRPEGNPNGFAIPSLSDDKLFYFLN